MRDKLTLITPVRIEDSTRFDHAKQAIETFYGAVGPGYRHLVAAANPWRYRRKFKKLLNSVGAQWEPIATGSTALDGFIAMVEATETDYLFPLLSDVKTMTDRDFITPCIEAMERDPSLVQVRICGYPFSNGETNTSYLYSTGEQVCFDGDRSIALKPEPIGEDTVWTLSMAPENQKYFYAVPLWNTVLRTSYVKRCIDAVRPYLDGCRTITDLSDKINDAPDLTDYDLPEKGWQEHLLFMNDYRQGSLNLACYMYALGWEQKTEAEFLNEQMRELKAVPAEGKL